MEKSPKHDDLKDTTPVTTDGNAKDERVKEKVVYKVVPVPYYYPVPVDAEWYYKHYEPPMRNGERGFHGYPDDPPFDHFPFPPIPGHGFPGPRSALRESYYYASSRDEDERYLRPVSPLYRHVSSRGSHYTPPSSDARKPKENGVTENGLDKEDKEDKNEKREREDNEENLSPRSVSVKSEHAESENEENKRNGEFESQSEGDAGRSDREDHGDDKTSNSDSEVSRKRKRFPMTFPYDQRKKILKETSIDRNGETNEHTNGHIEDINESPSDYKRRSSDESDSRVYSSHKYPSNGSTPNGHYPYVMVPLRSPPYADIRPSPRYAERSHSYYESRLYDDGYTKEPSPGGGRNKDDPKREIRYHPNGRRARTVFTRQQLLTLNNVFEKHPFVSGERMSELSDQLGLDRKIVKIWFQNKRQYARKKGSLVERSDEYYYDYQDNYNPASAPPSMAAERWKVEN